MVGARAAILLKLKLLYLVGNRFLLNRLLNIRTPKLYTSDDSDRWDCASLKFL